MSSSRWKLAFTQTLFKPYTRLSCVMRCDELEAMCLPMAVDAEKWTMLNGKATRLKHVLDTDVLRKPHSPKIRKVYELRKRREKSKIISTSEISKNSNKSNSTARGEKSNVRKSKYRIYRKHKQPKTTEEGTSQQQHLRSMF